MTESSLTEPLAHAGRIGKAGYWVTVHATDDPHQLLVRAHVSRKTENWPGIGAIMRAQPLEGMSAAHLGIAKELESRIGAQNISSARDVEETRYEFQYTLSRDVNAPGDVAQLIVDYMSIGVESARVAKGGTDYTHGRW